MVAGGPPPGAETGARLMRVSRAFPVNRRAVQQHPQGARRTTECTEVTESPASPSWRRRRPKMGTDGVWPVFNQRDAGWLRHWSL